MIFKANEIGFVSYSIMTGHAILIQNRLNLEPESERPCLTPPRLDLNRPFTEAIVRLAGGTIFCPS